MFRFLLIMFLPWLQMTIIGRPFSALIILALQVTIIGWLPASIWTSRACKQYDINRKIWADMERDRPYNRLSGSA